MAAATAYLSRARTSPATPNTAPPRRPAVARATTASVSTTARSTAGPANNLPAAWGAAGALLVDQAHAVGTNAPINAALLESAHGDTGAVDLSAMWTLPQQPGQAQGRVAIRRLDDKGRMLLPISLSSPSKISAPAERDGAVTTVFLPGSTERPDPARSLAPLPLDERGRLSTINAATRRQVGWQPGIDVMVTYDLTREVLTMCSVAALHEVLVAGMETLKAPASTVPNLASESRPLTA